MICPFCKLPLSPSTISGFECKQCTINVGYVRHVKCWVKYEFDKIVNYHIIFDHNNKTFTIVGGINGYKSGPVTVLYRTLFTGKQIYRVDKFVYRVDKFVVPSSTKEILEIGKRFVKMQVFS